MAENSEELRLWEMSILDEQISLPAEVVTALEAAGIRSDGKMNVPSAVDGNDDIVEHFAKVAEKVSSATGSDLPALSARMCTVSHCHKILPGYYRYKRCEQHRLQNRHHSKLKRVREKVVKALGPEEGAQTISIDPALRSRSASLAPGEEAETAGQLDDAPASLIKESTPGVFPSSGGDGKAKKVGDISSGVIGHSLIYSGTLQSARRPLSCTTDGCQNLLPLEKRWKRCDLCRLTERRRKADDRKAAPGNSGSAQQGEDDAPESTTGSCASSAVTAMNHGDNGERAHHISLYPSTNEDPPPDSRMQQERQQSRLQQGRGDNDTSSGAVLVQVRPNVEMNSHTDQTTDPSPRQPLNAGVVSSRSGSTGPLSTSIRSHQPNDAGLRMVNLTSHAFTNSAVPFSWANATAGARSSYPNNADMPTVMSTNPWEQGSFTTSVPPEDSSRSALAPPSLTFKEYRPTKGPTKAPTPGVHRFLARHLNVTVEAYQALLGQLDVKEQDGVTGADNGAAASIGRDSTLAENGKQNPALTAPGAPATISSHRSAAGYITASAAASAAAQTTGNAEPRSTSANTNRLDIPNVATSTAEPFRFYIGPRDASNPDCAIPSAQTRISSTSEVSMTHAATEHATPALFGSEGRPKSAAESSTARKRKSNEGIGSPPLAAHVAPSITHNVTENVSPDSSVPLAPLPSGNSHATRLSNGYPAYPTYVGQQANAALPYPYAGSFTCGQMPGGSYPMLVPAAASYTHFTPAPYAVAFTSHGGSVMPPSTVPYPYNTYMPSANIAPASAPSTTGHETPASGAQGSPGATHPSIPPRTRTTSSAFSSEKAGGSKDGTRFAYYHPGIGTTDSPDPGDPAVCFHGKLWMCY